MTGIIVTVAPPTSRGRLYPRYVEDAGILAVESKVERPYPFGVDIDGRIVFDLDDDRVLANFDLHIPRRLWKKGLTKDPPAIAPPGDLVFATETLTIKSFSLPLLISTDQGPRRVRIEFGTKPPDRGVSLSESCVALLAGSELVGFCCQGF